MAEFAKETELNASYIEENDNSNMEEEALEIKLETGSFKEADSHIQEEDLEIELESTAFKLSTKDKTDSHVQSTDVVAVSGEETALLQHTEQRDKVISTSFYLTARLSQCSCSTNRLTTRRSCTRRPKTTDKVTKLVSYSRHGLRMQKLCQRLNTLSNV